MTIFNYSIYSELLHHPTSIHQTPGGGTILESEHEDDESEVAQEYQKNEKHKESSSLPSMNLSLSDSDLHRQSSPPKQHHQFQMTDDDASFIPPSISPAPSISSSIYTQSTHPSHTLQSILFGDNTEGIQKNQSATGDDIGSLSLYDLSQSISSSTSQNKNNQNSNNSVSSSTSTTDKKKKKKSTTSTTDQKDGKGKSSEGKKKKDENKELENLLGVSLSSINSVGSDKMGVTVVGPIEPQIQNNNQKNTKQLRPETSSGSKKYW